MAGRILGQHHFPALAGFHPKIVDRVNIAPGHNAVAAIGPIDLLANVLTRLGLLKEDAEYHLLRASMVVIFFFFGYQKWFAYEVDRLIPFISNGPLIFWLYPLLGMRGATLFLGVSEWTFGTLLLLGFWNKRLGILGAVGSIATFVGTVTIIPFMPEGWDAAAGGFPAMTGNVPFLMKDVVLLAVSVYLLKQDVQRVVRSTSVPAFSAVLRVSVCTW